MVSVAADDVSDVVVYALGKDWRIVPELPSWRVVNHKKSQFVAGIHESRVLRAVCVADDFQSRVAQFFCVAPVKAVWYGVADNGKVLMPVCSNQWTFVRLSVQPKAVLAFEFNTAYADALAVSVDNVSFLVQYAYKRL